MASLKIEVRKEKEEKQRAEKEIALLQAQQQQPQPPPQPRLPVHDTQLQPDGQTPEQMAARDFVQQWSRGMQPTAHNDTQSNMTGLAHQFRNLQVNHVHELSHMLAQLAQAINSNKPVERLHLTSSEEQHIKTIAQQVERDEIFYNSQIQHIAAMKIMQ
jgi:hypothetical protein